MNFWQLYVNIPKLQKYAEDNFGCELKINTLCTIEGQTSVEVTLKHSAGKEDVSLVILILKEDRLIPLLKTIVKTLAGFLPLPYSICNRWRNKHKNRKCP